MVRLPPRPQEKRIMIEKKSLADLTPVEWKACYTANYGAGGYMRNTFMNNRYNQDAFVLMVWDGPHDSAKNMLAWALATPVTSRGYTSATYYARKRAKYTVQFWVKRPYRQRGIGHSLMQEIKKYDETPHVFPHDDKSGEFFSGYNVTATASERTWMRNNKPKAA